MENFVKDKVYRFGETEYNRWACVHTTPCGGVMLHEVTDSVDFIPHDRLGNTWREVKPKREVWFNIYPSGSLVPHSSKASADRDAADVRVACVKVVYEEGQYDE